MRRIIGQCHTADFVDLTHISDLLKQGKEVDLSNLSNRQKVAVRVIDHFIKKKIPLKLMAKITEVLVWDMGDDKVAFEYKLLDRGDVETAKLLRGYY